MSGVFRVNQAGAEALYSVSGVTSRTTKVGAEALYSVSGITFRSKQIGVETIYAVGSDDVNLRSRQAVAEVIYSEENNRVRVTQNLLSVLYKPATNLFVPTGDISTGNWNPTPIYPIVDADDGSCVSSALTPSNDTFEVSMAPLTDFDKDRDLKLQYQFGKVTSGDAPADDGDTINLTVAVYDGATEVRTWIHSGILGNEAVTIQYIETVGRDKISNPDNISVRVTADTASASTPRKAQFCFVNALTHDAGTGSIESTHTIPIGYGASAGGGSSADVSVGVDGSSSGTTYHGDAVVNYQNTGGTVGIGWQIIRPTLTNTGNVTTLNTKFASRFNDTRYYRS
jgi:hypothetical protein